MNDTPKQVRWLKVGLYLSLAVNLAIAGLFAGMVLRDGPPHRGGRGPGHEGFLYLRAFTDDQRQDLRRAFREEMGHDEKDRGERRQAFRERFLDGYEQAATTLRQDPFERDALAQVLNTQAMRSREGRARGQQVLLDYLADMSPEARADYADRLLREIEDISKR
ncbi:membrane protein [Roseivivax halodurans JCM 10272]|uniref:Membrane protein n=1 Tax=Roseivivax halodurans JCM 10272 TaxID=1449350 RepID=X7EFP4_9RHOB|nr:periplasmic heavy metal sensor [Roseivivax halodurans]ETX14767.1 membrane protein [Roseivivax halodurans JCM 10272]